MAGAAPPQPVFAGVPANSWDPEAPAEPPGPAVAAASEEGDATITPIDVNQRKRSDGPLRP